MRSVSLELETVSLPMALLPAIKTDFTLIRALAFAFVLAFVCMLVGPSSFSLIFAFVLLLALAFLGLAFVVVLSFALSFILPFAFPRQSTNSIDIHGLYSMTT